MTRYHPREVDDINGHIDFIKSYVLHPEPLITPTDIPGTNVEEDVTGKIVESEAEAKEIASQFIAL